MEQINTTLLKQIKALDLSDISERFIPNMMFRTNNEWKFWVTTDKGLIKTKAWPAEMIFFSDADPEPDDLNLHFFNFFYQRANYTNIGKLLEGVTDDILNLGASLAKIELISDNREDLKQRAARLVTTEIEYIYQVSRSIFDLLQEILSVLWERIHLFGSLKKEHLKKHFSDMVLTGQDIRTKSKIIDKFKLPEFLACFYSDNADFFCKIRNTRDAIIHGGKSFDVIFVTEKGFAIDRSKQPFASLYDWKEEECLENSLGLLNPVINTMVKATIKSCESLSQILERHISFPSKIAPNHSVYLRGYHNKYLLKAIKNGT